MYAHIIDSYVSKVIETPESDRQKIVARLLGPLVA